VTPIHHRPGTANGIANLSSRLYTWTALAVILAMLLGSCAQIGLIEPGPAVEASATPPYPTPAPRQPPPEAVIVFRVRIPADKPADQGVMLNILDEVSGLGFNVQRYQMEAQDAANYLIGIPFPVGSVVKYRYTRQGDLPVDEFTSDGRLVRYRMVYVEAPGTVDDLITRWSDNAYPGPYGRVQGQVIDNASGLPLVNILVACGGAQTLTDAQGGFVIEGLQPGIHNLVAYALDGAYRPFQQGAEVAVDSSTQAEIRLEKAPLVNLTFTVIAPPRTPPVVPLRLAGNLYQLGNTFASLRGGMSVVPTRMPVMAPLPDGRYSLTLSLPAGTDLRYKYTLGDGFWNAERSQEAGYIERQVIVPEQDSLIEDQVFTWQDGPQESLSFDVRLKEALPPGEEVSIQFSTFAWSEPIPMWRLGEDRWVYLLYSPLNDLSSLSYRYCRNEQCGVADGLDTAGPGSKGYSQSLSFEASNPAMELPGWNYLVPELAQPQGAGQFGRDFAPRPAEFMRGLEYQPAYHPTWQAPFSAALRGAAAMPAGWVVLTPTWTFTRRDPVVLEALPGKDALWPDLLSLTGQAGSAGLQVALFPTPHFRMPANEWWADTRRDFSWWVVWFERYRAFLLHNAELAQRAGAGALILGGDWLDPALPGGKMPNGDPSGVPEDAELRWRALIAEVRAVYSGRVLWAAPLTQQGLQTPAFVDAVDQVYVLWSLGLTEDAAAGPEALGRIVARWLDEVVLPFQEASGKPVVLAAAYPSAEGGITGCVADPSGGCAGLEDLLISPTDVPLAVLDLQEQADIYQALLTETAQRDWIAGFVSRGNYPAAVLHDPSTSVRGKPAAAVLRAAFRAWAGQNPE
jgi:hypothetical protein